MRILYTLSVKTYFLLVKLSATFGNPKAKKWIIGRKKWKEQLTNKLPKNAKVIWFHTASLGEFEQARPLIEKFKKEKPNYFLLLSFFSPSGYEVQKSYKYADLACYLPLDTKRNAKEFIELTKPKLAVFVKYEFWFNYLAKLKKEGIETYLVSGIFRPSQHFFKFYGRWFRKQLVVFKTFYLQNETSKTLLEKIGFINCQVSGDTRFDRVIELSLQPFNDSRISTFCKEKKTLIFGSSWSKENELAQQLSVKHPELQLIIAPHEVNPSKILELKNSFTSNAILWSETTEEQDLNSFQILIIDQIGILSKIYRFANIAIIGGGFGAGIHNVLEAAVYGCPILFGPNYQKFQEAKDLIDLGGAFSISNYIGLKTQLDILLNDKFFYKKSSEIAKAYIQEKAGASNLIFKELITQL